MDHDDQVPHARKGKQCPQYRRDMSEVCHDCGWWVGLSWEDPVSKQIKSRWNCAMVVSALGQVDVARSMGGVQAATESMRNEVVKRAVSPPAWAVQQVVRDALAQEQQAAFALEQSEPRKLIEN